MGLQGLNSCPHCTDWTVSLNTSFTYQCLCFYLNYKRAPQLTSCWTVNSCNFFEHLSIHIEKSKEEAKDIAQLPGYLPSHQEAWCSVPSYGCNLNIEEVEKEATAWLQSACLSSKCMGPLIQFLLPQEKKTTTKNCEFWCVNKEIDFTTVSLQWIFYFFKITFSFICVSVCVCKSGQLVGVSFLFPWCGYWVSNSGCQTWHQTPYHIIIIIILSRDEDFIELSAVDYIHCFHFPAKEIDIFFSPRDRASL